MYDFLRRRFGIVLGGVNYLSVGMFDCIWMDGMVAGCLFAWLYLHTLASYRVVSISGSVFVCVKGFGISRRWIHYMESYLILLLLLLLEEPKNNKLILCVQYLFNLFGCDFQM